jgi:hypothetical protein
VKTKDVELFLAELSDLTRKHGIKISGCGCCGSPYLYETDTPQAGQTWCYEVDGMNDYLCYVCQK